MDNPERLFGTLLSRALIQRGNTLSAVAAEGVATREFNRTAYIIKVLKASAFQRAAVKAECLASDSDGQHQLADIITIFENLSVAKKAEFISAYRGAGTFVGHGPISIILEHSWSPHHVPPIFPP